ncbi:MAG: hypothetical protein WA738_15265, partial [Candidatus Angelobacter sp.]
MVKTAFVLIFSVAEITAVPAARGQQTVSGTAREEAAVKREDGRLLAEARSKVLQIFGRAVILAEGPDAKILTGDFNGDGWQDLAVVVRCAPGQSGMVNDPYAN